MDGGTATGGRPLYGRQQTAVFGHRSAHVKHLFGANVRQVGKDHQIGLAARGDRTGILDAEVVGRVDRSHADGCHRVQTFGHGLANHRVHVTLGEQVVGMAVVGAPHHAAPGVLADHGKQGVQVTGAGALAHHDVHAQFQLFQRFVGAGALVVRGDAGGRVGEQLAAGKTRGVAVHGAPMTAGQGQFGHHIAYR
jgi:hypothetical protein